MWYISAEPSSGNSTTSNLPDGMQTPQVSPSAVSPSMSLPPGTLSESSYDELPSESPSLTASPPKTPSKTNGMLSTLCNSVWLNSVYVYVMFSCRRNHCNNCGGSGRICPCCRYCLFIGYRLKYLSVLGRYLEHCSWVLVVVVGLLVVSVTKFSCEPYLQWIPNSGVDCK